MKKKTLWERLIESTDKVPTRVWLLWSLLVVVTVIGGVIWQTTHDYCNPEPIVKVVFSQQLQAEPTIPWSNAAVYLIDKYALGLGIILALWTFARWFG